MRSMWTGALGFGLVNIPVKMYKATESSESTAMCNTHKACGTAVKAPKYCPTCNCFVDEANMQKGYPLDSKKTQIIPITEEDLKSLPLASAHQIKVDGFNKTRPDFRYGETIYALAPDKGGERAFVLFMQAMQDEGVIGIAKITTGTKEHLCAVVPQDGYLFIQTLHWADEIRPLDEIKAPAVKLTEKELAMAKMLLGTMPQDIDLADYKDEYGEALLNLVEAKKSGAVITAQATPAVTPEEDLISSLMASLKAMEPAK